MCFHDGVPLQVRLVLSSWITPSELSKFIMSPFIIHFYGALSCNQPQQSTTDGASSGHFSYGTVPTSGTVKLHTLHPMNPHLVSRTSLNLLRNNFEQGAVDKFIIRSEDVGPLLRMKIWSDDKGMGSAWHLEYVTVVSR